MNLFDLIQQAAATWMAQERANAQSLPGQIAQHITTVGKLRLPQREAIDVYLWLKFSGKNQSLGDLIRSGALMDEIPPESHGHDGPLPSFLRHFAKSNDLSSLHEMVRDDPQGARTNWSGFLDSLLHDFRYPLYLYSLPMGAGKT